MTDRAQLGELLGVRIGRTELLDRALTHASYAAEHPDLSSNERLEFLGDAVLQMVVTEFIFDEWPDFQEGELAKIRAASVSGPRLAVIARRLALGTHILLGRGEEASGGRDKDSILADSLEALVAAVYLDQGFDTARRIILDLWEDQIRAAARQPGSRDFKTRLQEMLARRGLKPRYRVSEEGLDHEKTFEATVEIKKEIAGRGVGRSKKQAEQEAAAEALRKYGVPT